MAEFLLGGDPLQTFQNILMGVTMPVDLENSESMTENEETFVITMNRFIKSFFPQKEILNINKRSI